MYDAIPRTVTAFFKGVSARLHELYVGVDPLSFQPLDLLVDKFGSGLLTLTFKLLPTFDDSYPKKPLMFLSRMFHPNVYANREIYICIYKTSGHPHITSLLSLQASLAT